MDILDAKGLKCPLPVLRAAKKMRGMEAGDELEVLADDPSAPKDFEEFCETTGNEITSFEDKGDHYRWVLKKAE